MHVVVREVVGPDRGGRPRRRAGRRRRAPRGAVRSTSVRSSPTPPARQTCTPFMVTSRAAGSKAAAVVPTAASTRPQLGSLPNTAHLNRLLRATARATSSASSTDAAERTSTAMSWWAPSASATSWRASDGADLGHGIRQVVGADLDARGAGGEQHDGVVGRHAAVGVDPVEGRRRRAPQHGVEVGAVDDGIRRDDDEHRRQRRGEHAGALGHATDRPAVAPRHRASWRGCRWS